MEGVCSASVWSGWHSHKCVRKAKIEVEGRLFCGIHNPVRKKSIEDEKMKKYNKQRKIRDLNTRKHEVLEQLGLIIVNYKEDTIFIPDANEITSKVDEYIGIVEELESEKEG